MRTYINQGEDPGELRVLLIILSVGSESSSQLRLNVKAWTLDPISGPLLEVLRPPEVLLQSSVEIS